jgi:hypothetical protein
MTIRDVFAEFVVFRSRQREVIDRDVVLAWNMAALSRQRRLPSLKSLLAKGEAPKAQTPKQMRSVLESLGYKSVPLSEAAKKATRLRFH